MGKVFSVFFIICALLMTYTIAVRFRMTMIMKPVEATLNSISHEHGMVGISRANTYNVKVTYSYSVDGSQYSGRNLSLNGNSYASKTKSDEIINKYQNADKITAWYDPGKPGFAVLEKPEVGFRLFAILMVTTALAVLCWQYMDLILIKLLRLQSKINNPTRK